LAFCGKQKDPPRSREVCAAAGVRVAAPAGALSS
jgi:hypothetical protein